VGATDQTLHWLYWLYWLFLHRERELAVADDEDGLGDVEIGTGARAVAGGVARPLSRTKLWLTHLPPIEGLEPRAGWKQPVLLFHIVKTRAKGPARSTLHFRDGTWRCVSVVRIDLPLKVATFLFMPETHDRRFPSPTP
jgi:hypothetical protein